MGQPSKLTVKDSQKTRGWLQRLSWQQIFRRRPEKAAEQWKFDENIEMSTTEETPRGRILVADDDPAILRLISTILEKENFAVVNARDGREAYKILQSDPNFTAAILDVVMPHISG